MIKQKIEIGFIILHYGDSDLTNRAVNSVCKLEGIENSIIIIVDNNSPIEKPFKLSSELETKKNIKILPTGENLGFSRGNNLGYRFVKENYMADFIVIMNNDILFPENTFIREVYTAYLNRHFYVGGTDIYVPRMKYHSSPLRRETIDLEDLLAEINTNINIIKESEKFFSLNLFHSYIKEVLLSNSKFHQFLIGLKRKICGDKKKNWNTAQYGNLVLQGSCLIFDKCFIAGSEKAFEPETFLYGEEYFLSEKCRKNQWDMNYIPTIQVHHTCQGSLITRRSSYRDYCKNKKQSSIISIESLEKYKTYVFENK